MKDYFYRFDDRAAMLAALEPLGMVYWPEPVDGEIQEPQVVEGTHQYAAWEVGEIQGYTGWHLNVRNIDYDLTSLDIYEVYPPNPKVVWA